MYSKLSRSGTHDVKLSCPNSWDEWVSSDRLLKHTEENLVKQKDLDKKQGVEKGTRSGRSAQTRTRSSAVGKGKKRKNESGNEKDNAPAEKLVKIQIPATLKNQLTDDWDNITQKDKVEIDRVIYHIGLKEISHLVVKLPRIPNVDEILTKYLELRIKKDGINQMKQICVLYRITDTVGEILKGIRCYFDKALPMMLLYDKERRQYEEAIADDISPSTVYGAEHLLRLFVKLPELFSRVNMEEETWTRLHHTLLDFLKFLQKNQSTFMVASAYESDKVSDGKGKGKGKGKE
ncbi:unnamed protein product [Thlaspi arvense]|uniref:MRG domain-containing protein n=1 Tax=Thlaspi arvense TaxID=13288 RepID=A0AAU9T2X5_THLAR|nr:unnamed protein product [Thlaspi arvense]